jgi:hypothetical protein
MPRLEVAASFAGAQAPDDEHCYCQASLRLYIAQLLARFLAASLTIRSTCETSRCPPRGSLVAAAEDRIIGAWSPLVLLALDAEG